jgi:hypothetical protein
VAHLTTLYSSGRSQAALNHRANACSCFSSYLQGCQMVCFQTQNPNLGKFWSPLHKLENVNIFYGHLEYFNEVWEILWPFGTFCIHLVHFPGFWYHEPIKIWQLCVEPQWLPWK